MSWPDNPPEDETPQAEDAEQESAPALYSGNSGELSLDTRRILELLAGPSKPEMGSVRFRVSQKIRRRPWPSAAHVRPASVPARTPRGARTPART